MTDQEMTVEPHINPGSDTFDPGHKGVIRGRLTFGKGGHLDFEKEFVAPSK